MAKQTINLGTGELTGDGESIRSAFDKINDNFDELYAVEHDLSAIDQSLIPDTDVAYDLGSATSRFRDIYLSGSTIDLGGLEISNVGGELKLDGVKLITQSELDVAVQNDITTNLTGSVFADDSTLLVDGVAGKIVGDVENSIVYTDVVYARNSDLYVNADDQASLYLGATNSQTIVIGASDSTIYLNGNQDSLVGAGKFFSPRGTDLNIVTLDMTTGSADAVIIKGGETSDSDNGAFGGNVKINAGRNSNALQQHGDIQIGTEFTNGVTIGTYDGGDGFGNTVSLAGYTVIVGNSNNLSNIQLKGNVDFSDAKVSNLDVELSGDLTGSVFADDSTLLVDGVNGTIPASVVSGTITNDISTSSLETITDIRFGTYADARKPKISIAGAGEHDIAITAGYDVNGDDSGNVSINANTDGVTPGVVNIATSSGELSLSKVGGNVDVFGQVEFHGNVLFQDGDGVEFNGPVDFSDATINGSFDPTGNVAVGGNLDVAGDSSTTGNIVVTGLAFVGDSLSVTGDATFSSNVGVSGDLDVVGHLSVTGTTDLKGSIFADDSTLLVDGVAGKIVGDYENGTSTIGSTMVRSYDVVALQDLNTLDSYVNGTLWGGATANAKNLVIGSTAPSTSNGASGDRSGMIAFDSTYIYYCTANYTDGVADIWKRVAWSADTW